MAQQKAFFLRKVRLEVKDDFKQVVGHLVKAVLVGQVAEFSASGRLRLLGGLSVAPVVMGAEDPAVLSENAADFVVAEAVLAHSVAKLDHALYLFVGNPAHYMDFRSVLHCLIKTVCRHN